MDEVDPIFIQALQPVPPNELLKKFVNSEIPGSIERVRTSLHAETKDTFSRNRIYFQANQTWSTHDFASVYAKGLMRDVFGKIYSTVNASITELKKANIDKFTSEDIDAVRSSLITTICERYSRKVFDQNHMKTMIYLWKRQLTSKELDKIEEAIKNNIDKAYAYAHAMHEFYIWKSAFNKQSVCQPISFEHSVCQPISFEHPEVSFNSIIDKRLKEMDVQCIPTEKELATIFLEEYQKFELYEVQNEKKETLQE